MRRPYIHMCVSSRCGHISFQGLHRPLDLDAAVCLLAEAVDEADGVWYYLRTHATLTHCATYQIGPLHFDATPLRPTTQSVRISVGLVKSWFLFDTLM